MKPTLQTNPFPSRPCGIKQGDDGKFYLVRSNGHRFECPPPVEMKLGNRCKTLFDPEGKDYVGGFTSAAPEHREHLLVSRDGGNTWRRIDFSLSS